MAKLEDIKFKDKTDLICDSQLFEKGELRIFFWTSLCGGRIIWKLLTAEAVLNNLLPLTDTNALLNFLRQNISFVLKTV